MAPFVLHFLLWQNGVLSICRRIVSSDNCARFDQKKMSLSTIVHDRATATPICANFKLKRNQDCSFMIRWLDLDALFRHSTILWPPLITISLCTKLNEMQCFCHSLSKDSSLVIDVGDSEGLRVAKVKVNSELTPPCGTSILYPNEGGNIHRFTAKTACAVLDVLGPPYCDPEGRHCQYYQELPFGKISGTLPIAKCTNLVFPLS